MAHTRVMRCVINPISMTGLLVPHSALEAGAITIDKYTVPAIKNLSSSGETQ